MDVSRARKDALAVFRAAVRAVDPARAVRKQVKREGERLRVAKRTYDLSTFQGIYVVGAGKASAAMAQAVEEILGGRITAGIINVKTGHDRPLERIRVVEAGHPVPDEAGRRGAEEIVDLLGRAGEKDLVLFLLSGGGSALLPYPLPGLSLEDKKKMTTVLLEAGAAIGEINALRKHVSAVKGGRLARAAAPAAQVSLILSDVVGDPLDSIASGPTVPDRTTFADCLNILEKYDIKKKMPQAVVDLLEKGTRGEVEETPKAGDPAFGRAQHLIVGSNLQAVLAAEKKARILGYNTLILSTFIEGETREVAKVHAAVAREVLSTGHPVRPPACILSGGETTVTIRGKGKGGRNQEFALAAAIKIDGLEGVVVLSCGTDGTDGPTDAAGAVVDGATVHRARSLGLDPEAFLRNNDSYAFFKELGDLVVTGPTFTNVMDVRLVMVGRKQSRPRSPDRRAGTP